MLVFSASVLFYFLRLITMSRLGDNKRRKQTEVGSNEWILNEISTLAGLHIYGAFPVNIINFLFVIAASTNEEATTFTSFVQHLFKVSEYEFFWI